MFEVINVDTSTYLYEFVDVKNQDLVLIRGLAHEFNVNSPGLPFLIKSVNSTGTDNTFNSSVTNNGTADGTILFTVPANATEILF